MITEKEALDIATNDAEENGAIIGFLIDYDDSRYVYNIKEFTDTIDISKKKYTIYKSINKNDGSVSNFIPSNLSYIFRTVSQHNLVDIKE